MPVKEIPQPIKRRMRAQTKRVSRGSSKARRRRRLELFAVDPHECFRCGATVSLTVEHVIPLTLGGSKQLKNLRIFCFDCNMAKGKSPWFGIYLREFFEEMEG